MSAAGRLKVLWEDRAEFIERERRWDAVRDLSPPYGSPLVDASQEIFDLLPDWDYARQGYNRDGGVLKIRDLEGLCRDLGLEREAITSHPAAFEDGDLLIAPWPVTQEVLRLLAERNAEVLLAEVDRQERKAVQRCRWGEYDGNRHIPAEVYVDLEEEYRVIRAHIRELCGGAARDRHDELVALRAEVTRLGLLVEEAVSALESLGAGKVARRIARELGVPLEVVRAQQAHKR